MLGCCSSACTKRAGRNQAPLACHNALGGAGGDAAQVHACPASASSCDQLCGAPPLRVLPGRRRSCTPVGAQSVPSRSRVRMACCMVRTPARDRREIRLSSGEVCGATKPTGKPEAPAAGASPASSTVTCQPRSASARAVPAPAMPEPSTVTVRSPKGGSAALGVQGPVG